MCGNGIVVTEPFLKNVLVTNFYRLELDKWVLYSVLENILPSVQFIYCFKGGGIDMHFNPEVKYFF